VSAPLPDPLGEAAAWIREGGLLAYPTETVWGLGADARQEKALERLRRWKGRGEDAPMAILVEGPEALEPLRIQHAGAVRRLGAAFWPGPLTLVLACRERFAAGVARSDGAVGVRCSSHPLAAALARRLRQEGVGPITATSLNPTGQPPARTRDEAAALCGEGAEEPHLISVPEAESAGDEVSTVLDLTGDEPVVLRWGALAEKELAPVLREVRLS
jgi:L-threonylcarbamoyladenylate synthase